MFDIDQIDPVELELVTGYYGTVSFIKSQLNDDKEISDEVFSWVVNTPPIYAAFETDELKKKMREHAEKYVDNKEPSIKLVQRIKNEFYNFLCTESGYYEKERLELGGNINTLITALSVAIATKIGGLAVGVVASFVVLFIIVVGKMGKKIACDFFSENE